MSLKRHIVLLSVGLVFVACLVAGGLAAFTVARFLNEPPRTPGEEAFIDIEPGATFDQVATLLKDKGLITDARLFFLYAKWKNKLGAIQAGEFRVHTGWVPAKVLETLVSGKPVLYRLQLREGLAWWEVARIVEKAGYATFDEFAALIRDKDILERWNIPQDSAEGYLYPETYLLKRPRGKEGRQIVEMLLKSFWDHAAKVWPGGPPEAAVVRRTVIFASLVERETALPEERPRVAGVYAKRLKIGMLLQCDPTTVYGLGLSFNGNLTRKHLQDAANPYNTYVHPGMPPTPICSPGLASLLAAAGPEEHKFLYFVSKNDGSHQFSSTLDEHNAAVRKYQIGQPKPRREGKGGR